MKIPILGMDPSLTNWGLASALLDLDTGIMDHPFLQLICPDDLGGKQIRVNSNDMHRAEQLATVVFAAAQKAKVIFVEMPVGSQSARAMASYGICIGIVGALRASQIPVIEVTAREVKLGLSGNKHATKRQMIDSGVRLYPHSNWTSFYPGQRNSIPDKAEHVADAIGAIHAGVQTPTFQTLLRLFQKV